MLTESHCSPAPGVGSLVGSGVGLAFTAQAQSITFGLDHHVTFFNTLMGLVSDGREPMVQVATWRDDWASVRSPERYVLLSVVKREDMGGAALAIEAAPGYAFLTPCTPAGMPLPDAVSIIVPSTRIARLHVPRASDRWQPAGLEQLPVRQFPTAETAPVPRPDTTLVQPAPLTPLPSRRLARLASQRPSLMRRALARLTGPSTQGSEPVPDGGVETLAAWVSSLSGSPQEPSSGAGHASAA